MHQEERTHAKLEYESWLGERLSEIEREIKLNTEALYTLKGLFDGSEEVLPDEFQVTVNEALKRHSDLRALAWVPVVKHEAREEAEAKRKMNSSSYIFTEIGESGEIKEAEERDVYFPIYYLEPLLGNEATFGLDLAADSQLLSIIEYIRDNETIGFSSDADLGFPSKKSDFFILFLPVYKGAHTTITQRQMNFQGSVIALVSIKELIGALSDNKNFTNHSVELVERTKLGYGVRVLSHQNEPISAPEVEKCIKPIDGYSWCLRGNPPVYRNGESQYLVPGIILFCGFSLFSVFAFIFYQQGHRQKIIEKLVDKRTKELDRLNMRLVRLSAVDELTKLDNRRALDEKLSQEWQRLTRDKQPLTLMMIDIDHFKNFNDHYGHLEGDKCLAKVAEAIKAEFFRPADTVARYGGEEFLVILPNTSEESKVLADRCCERVRNLKIPHELSQTSKNVTISIGIATTVPAQDKLPESLIKLADEALYRAKQEGRDRYCVAG